MNQDIAIVTTFAFLSLVSIYNLIFGIVNWDNRKIAKKWIWTRFTLSFFALLGSVLFAYVFFLSK